MPIDLYKKALDDLEKIQENHSVISNIADFIILQKSTVYLIGIGKSGFVAQKAAASMVSTGTKAFFLHPSEAVHGDIGAVEKNDVCIFLSYSGESTELLPVAQKLRSEGIKVVSIVANSNSSLAKLSDFIIKMPAIKEATHLPAPFVSTVISLITLDLLCIDLINKKKFDIESYKRNHPAGKIGYTLKNVEEVMHKDLELPLVNLGTKMSSALVTMSEKRLGILIVVNQEKILQGIISDGDLRRHMSDHLTTEFVENIMSKSPKTISPNALCIDALNIMRKNKITSLVVTNHDNIVLGMIHIHQLLEMFGDE